MELEQTSHLNPEFKSTRSVPFLHAVGYSGVVMLMRQVRRITEPDVHILNSKYMSVAPLEG